jgi:3-dehydroquinate synthase
MLLCAKPSSLICPWIKSHTFFGLSREVMSQPTFFLYGPPGSGKTTIGKILADAIRLPFFDLDVEIENRWGSTIPQIFSDHGEAGFRQAEEEKIKQLLTKGEAVIALGGGTLVNPAVRTLVQDHGSVLCLQAADSVLIDRLSGNADDGGQKRQRPLLAGDVASKLLGLLSQRAEHYASFSLQLDTTHLDPERAAWEVQIILGRFHLAHGNQPYDVCIQTGGIDSAGEMIVQRGLRGPAALITDSNLETLYAVRVMASLGSAGISSQMIAIPSGESHKTIEYIQTLWDGFLDAGLDRGSFALALGGGVVGDMTGFAASTYMRGIRWVNIPTSLLAMVDSSLGGKTGVDIPRGKNLVGSFHPPALVLTDPEVLQTLPEVEFRSGMAEAIKHGVIADLELFEQCARPHKAWEISRLVSRAMAVKVRIIEADPYEKGVRAALNLGHTVGHAVELVSGYHLRHGEAISIGMVVEARMAERLGLAEPGLSQHIAAVLAGTGLPVKIPADLDRAAIRQAIQMDKKKSQGRIRFALPVRIGEVKIGIDVPDNVLAAEI